MAGTVVIITPVHTDPEFRRKMAIVRSICERLGAECAVPQAEPNRFDIDAAIETMRRARMIVADLSFGRPSCYYEVGLAEGRGARVALIAEAGTEIFQHSGRGTVAFYAGLTEYEALVSRLLRAMK